MLSEITCPSVTDIEHAHIIGSEVTFNSSIIVACDLGYELDDGVSNVTVTCQGDGEWSANISALQCSSRFLNISIVIRINVYIYKPLSLISTY